MFLVSLMEHASGQMPPNTFLKFTSVKKEFHAMQLLAVCQEDLLFTHVYTGWPGSCHDQRVLENDPFFYPEN